MSTLEIYDEAASVVIEIQSTPEVIELDPQGGPQGPAGDAKFHVGPLPPTDLTMLWVNTSIVEPPVNDVSWTRSIVFASLIDDWDGSGSGQPLSRGLVGAALFGD